MKFKAQLITAFLLLFIFNHSNAQDRELSEEEIKMIYDIKYNMVGQVFLKKSSKFSKTKPLVLAERLVVTPFSKTEIINAVSYLEKNAKVAVEKGMFDLELKLSGNFPSTFKGEDPMKYRPKEFIEINLLESNLTNSANEKVELQKYSSSNFKFFSQTKESSDTEIGWGDKEDYTIVENGIKFKNKEQIKQPITGSLSYEIKFLTGYEQKKISKKDIGTSITIQNTTYTIINIIDNKIVLDPPKGERVPINHDIDLINLDATGENELVAYSMVKIMELTKTDPRYKEANSSMGSSFTISKDDYDFFNAHPNGTIEEYIAGTPIEKMMKRKDKENYHVYTTNGPIDHGVIFYAPIYEIKKVIKVKM